MINSKSLLVNRLPLYYSIRVVQVLYVSDTAIEVVILVVNRYDDLLFHVNGFYSTIEKRVA